MVAVRGLLLDTSVLIEIERGAFDLDAVEDGEDVGVAAITVTEFLLGARLASGAIAERRQRFAEHVVETCGVVQYDAATARIMPRSSSTADALAPCAAPMT